MEKIAVIPGSFDPLTRGHESVIRRAALLFARVIVAVGVNTQKKYMFSAAQRTEWIRQAFSDLPNVSAAEYQGLTVDFCKQSGAAYIVRGLRSAADLEYERSIAHLNRTMAPGIETVFLLTEPEFECIHASMIREIITQKGDVSAFVPEAVKLK